MSLHDAAQRGSLATLRRLLQEPGADVNARDRYQMTALMYAARAGRPWTVRTLLEAGADVNLESGTGETALTLAMEHDDPQIVSELVRAGAEITDEQIAALPERVRAGVVAERAARKRSPLLGMREYMLNRAPQSERDAALGKGGKKSRKVNKKRSRKTRRISSRQ